MSKPAEVYACLYAREFPAQALLRLRPELREKTCVVMDGEPPLQEVCSLTKMARGLGMMRGMTQVEVETFAGVTALRRSEKEEAAARQVLLECAGGFSPRVEERSENGAFLCVIDIAGTRGLFGSPETLAQSLLARVRALGITACVAVSINFHAAVAVAKAPLPLSVRVIPTGEESTALASLPLAVLDLNEKQAETFSMWGIRTLGMLAALPEKELISRLGQDGKRLRQRARGEMPHLFQPVEPVFELRRAHGTGFTHRSARCTDVRRECIAGADDSPCDGAHAGAGFCQHYAHVRGRHWAHTFWAHTYGAAGTAQQ